VCGWGREKRRSGRDPSLLGRFSLTGIASRSSPSQSGERISSSGCLERRKALIELPQRRLMEIPMPDPISIEDLDLVPIPGKTYFNIDREWREEFIYFLLIDRFQDEVSRQIATGSARSFGVVTPNNFYGGRQRKRGRNAQSGHSSRGGPRVRRLAAGGNEIRTLGPPVEYSIFRDCPGRGDGKPARQTEPVLTIGKRRFSVRRARLAPTMISTPGHRASRRRQRGALPAWSLFGSSRPMPGDAVSCRSSIYVTSRSFGTRG
jgi:hypothetical protein